MPRHERFSFGTSEDLLGKASELGVCLPFQESCLPLLEPTAIGERLLPNRLAVHPMEGFDSEPDGSPIGRKPSVIGIALPPLP